MGLCPTLIKEPLQFLREKFSDPSMAASAVTEFREGELITHFIIFSKNCTFCDTQNSADEMGQVCNENV